jgi:hypothetical protein
MAQTPDSTALHAAVARVVDQAAERLKTAADDAQERQTALSAAKKGGGNNRQRVADIRAALDGEAELVLDARALAKLAPSVKRSMGTDLERLLSVALGED